MTTVHHLTHPHELTLRGEVRYLTHRDRYEPCGCLIANVECLGHRVGCRNTPTEEQGCTVADHERFHIQTSQEG